MQHDDTSSTRPQDASDDDWLKAAGAWWSEALASAGAGFRARLDADARTAAKLPPEPDQVDPDLFRQHVGADLDAMVRGYACFVRLGMSSYSDAYNSCRLFAWRQGAWGFNPVHLAELQDWIHAALSAAIDEVP